MEIKIITEERHGKQKDTGEVFTYTRYIMVCEEFDIRIPFKPEGIAKGSLDTLIKVQKKYEKK